MRVYGEIAQRKDYLVRNSVIFAIFSEKKLGPKLYGMYPQGRIEEYIPARALRTNELTNPKYSSQIAKKLAYFHTLEMPLCKSPSFLQDQLEEWLTEAEKILSRKIRQNVDQKCLQKLKSMDLRKEWHCLL
ncbi:hypothetical protein FSP39_007053 [Pinctada imbricata]|uniref:Uncharacterized protein n=1 Tax=Pinctada imbricata TaxID=66713 RepID=A0AA88YAU3_PINIB|nr:hypothetical protein FSP39_007053 [Pinctada imbricata]